MTAYLVRRFAVSVLVLFLVTVGLFGLVHAAPGDPVTMMVPVDQLGADSAAFIEQKRQELGLDRPLPVQYWSWLQGVATGDLGYSLTNNRPVSELLAERLVPTIELMGLGLGLGIAIAIPLGMLAAVRRNTAADYWTAALSLGAVSIPGFFLCILAIYVFALQLGWVPSAGMSTPGAPSLGDSLHHLVMPVAILAFGVAGPFTRYVRSGVIAELGSEYVRTAESKGATPRRILFGHVLRNALIPLITVLGLTLPALLVGAVVVEQIFAWPGMGQLVISAVNQQDYPVIIGFAFFVAILVLLSNMLADVLYSVADPRVSLQ
ncbi:ABC transporter permease subunit [Jiangella mangrovi]|uniref:Peptide/nickel transport system permease protein n=1 Tax=Jiangella mangrovi TaxID=1524084 RepID=A0A7W9LPE0_9ACTN|nr:peptide/nickel transport system permease protein [Jiangella mangrovi]